MIQSDGIWIAGMGEGLNEEDRNTEWNRMEVCPTHGWVGKHGLFGELETERGLLVVTDNMYVHINVGL